MEEGDGIPGVAWNGVDIRRNANGEGSLAWDNTDAEARKAVGEQTGLDTLVVHALKLWILDIGGIIRRCRSLNVLVFPTSGSLPLFLLLQS